MGLSPGTCYSFFCCIVCIVVLVVVVLCVQHIRNSWLGQGFETVKNIPSILDNLT